jgi:hypothetical protein
MGDQAKRVVFRYNDNDKDTDVEIDILGDLPRYAVGDSRSHDQSQAFSESQSLFPHALELQIEG